MKTITKSKAKKKAWTVFSKYIRVSSADEFGMSKCYTCNTRTEWKSLQAGHGIPGRNNAVLFMEEVVRPQCVGCNVFGRGKQGLFTFNLIKELGMGRYEQLVEESNQIVQYKTVDYQNIEHIYKEKLKQYEKSN